MLVIDYLFGYFVPFLVQMNRFATPLQQHLCICFSYRPAQYKVYPTITLVC